MWPRQPITVVVSFLAKMAVLKTGRPEAEDVEVMLTQTNNYCTVDLECEGILSEASLTLEAKEMCLENTDKSRALLIACWNSSIACLIARKCQENAESKGCTSASDLHNQWRLGDKYVDERLVDALMWELWTICEWVFPEWSLRPGDRARTCVALCGPVCLSNNDSMVVDNIYYRKPCNVRSVFFLKRFWSDVLNWQEL